VRAHGSLGRKEAAAYFISRNAYPHVGDEQRDGCRGKSDLVIPSLATTSAKDDENGAAMRRYWYSEGQDRTARERPPVILRINLRLLDRGDHMWLK
jgi:hypothetical protein